MSGEVHNPHDKFFKTWFSRPENLIPFLETALPANVFCSPPASVSAT
jgi:predicted transposase YdaD